MIVIVGCWSVSRRCTSPVVILTARERIAERAIWLTWDAESCCCCAVAMTFDFFSLALNTLR